MLNKNIIKMQIYFNIGGVISYVLTLFAEINEKPDAPTLVKCIF